MSYWLPKNKLLVYIAIALFVQQSYGQTTGISSEGGDSLIFYTNGNANGVLDVNGSFLLGTASDVNSSALFQLNSTTKGILIPRMTTIQRNAITNTEGLIIYNTQTSKFNFNDGSGWRVILSSNSNFPDQIRDLDSDTKIDSEQNTDEDKIRFTTDGVERAIITETGEVGIGTSTPSRLLSVAGAMNLSTITAPTTPAVGDVYSDGTNFWYHNGSTWEDLTQGGGTGGWNNSTPGIIHQTILDDSIGIGIATPLVQVHIANEGTDEAHLGIMAAGTGDARLSLLKSPGSLATPTANSSGDRLGAITFNGHDGTNYEEGAGIEGYSSQAWGASATGAELIFKTTANGTTSPLERVRITQDGRVGIGETSPTNELTIKNASVQVDLNHTNTANLSSYNMGEGGSLTSSITHYGSTSATNPNDLHITNYTTGAINFSIQGLLGTPAMRIDNVGNVGLGRGLTNPDVELHVYRSGTSPAVKIQGIATANRFASLLLESDEATDQYWMMQHTSTPANQLWFTHSPDDGTTNYTPIKFENALTNDALVVDQTGNVGIGTAAPTETLEVIGEIIQTSTITGAGTEFFGVDFATDLTGGTQTGSMSSFVTEVSLEGSSSTTGTLGTDKEISGSTSFVVNTTTGTTADLVGSISGVGTSGTVGNNSSSYGSLSLVSHDGSGGTITQAVGAASMIEIGTAGTGNITQALGHYVDISVNGTGAITNAVGLYIDDISSATGSNHAILTNRGDVLINDGKDPNSAFQIKSQGLDYLLYTDPTNNRIGIGTGTPAAELDIDIDGGRVLLPRKSTTGDPTGANGMIYYNGFDDKFRIFENGGWRDWSSPWIESAGNIFQTNLSAFVGIGTNAPSEKLSIGALGTATSVATQQSSERIALTGSFFNAGEVLHNITLQNVASTATAEEGRLAIGWNGGELMSVLSTGNVGIGTESPGGPLHIRSTNTNPNAGQLILESNSFSGPQTYATMEFHANFTSSSIAPVGRIKAYNTSPAFNTATMTFQTITGGPSFVDVLSLTNGRVGIGTTTPQYSLDVVGDARVGFNGNSDTIQVLPTEFITYIGTGSAQARFDVQGAGSGPAGMTTNASNINFAANINIPVGYRVKEVMLFTIPGPHNIMLYDANLEGGSITPISTTGNMSNAPVTLDAPLPYRHNRYLLIDIGPIPGGDLITGGYVIIEPIP